MCAHAVMEYAKIMTPVTGNEFGGLIGALRVSVEFCLNAYSCTVFSLAELDGCGFMDTQNVW